MATGKTLKVYHLGGDFLHAARQGFRAMVHQNPDDHMEELWAEYRLSYIAAAQYYFRTAEKPVAEAALMMLSSPALRMVDPEHRSSIFGAKVAQLFEEIDQYSKNGGEPLSALAQDVQNRMNAYALWLEGREPTRKELETATLKSLTLEPTWH